jgi:N-methylhydantoinase B
MPGIDPFTFEVLRHRLESIAREGAIALQRVSGSPLATEALDLNTSIMSARGEVAFVGPFLLTGPMGQGMIVRSILATYADNPGIERGEMFMSNDPYVGAAHQNCVTVVGPIHVGEELVAWCGATLHVVDVGGPTAGQVGVGASSIFEEAPPIPPLRIVAGGRLLRDVEAEYLRRSRTPELNGLDLRAKIAAVNAIRERVRELADELGADGIATVIETTIARAAAHLGRRIADLPRGSVSHSAYVDREEGGATAFYEIRLRLERQADRLVFDFRDSSPQAGAVVNCTRSGLASGVLVAVLTTLVWDAPWCPGAVERSIDIVSEPGTVVDASWPAGCSMATMAAGFAATTASALALGRLLAAGERHRDRAMASWAGAVGSVDMFGSDRDGRPFGTVLLDSMASGTGATPGADGIDSGGFLRSVSCVVSNVEHYEARFPILYLWRRHEPDTGGPGRRRGGVGVSYAVMPHGVDRIPAVIPHFSGTAQPESGGLLGGYPGASNRARVVAGSRVRTLLASGRLPGTLAELEGSGAVLPGVAALPLAADDVLIVVTTGGGGLGDPIERPPGLVAADVRSGLVTSGEARRAYGVAVDGSGAVDGTATARRRSAIRRARAGKRPAGGEDHAGRAAGRDRASPPAGQPADGVRWIRRTGRPGFRCRGCGQEWSSAGADPGAAATARRPLESAGPHRASGAGQPRFVLVEHYCSSCWRLVEAERAMDMNVEGDRA